jgi:hypothetical protein
VSRPQLSERAQKALRMWEDDCKGGHDTFLTALERRQKSYDAVLEMNSDAAQWTSKQHPPFVQHIVDTTLAGLIESKLSFRVRPKRRLWNDAQEFESVRKGAEAHEILHNCQMTEDRYSEKQRAYALQDAIAGLTVMKNSWRRERAKKPSLKVENAAPEELQALGVYLPRLVEVEEVQTVFDGPTSEVVNVEDFFWHEAAVELHKSPIVAHRVYMTYQDLKANEGDGPGQYRNVDQLKDSLDQGEEYSTNRRLDGTNRSKGMVEVLEIWWREPDGVYVVTLGNRKVELKAAKKNPFWHGEYPFVVCSTRPNLFQIPGKSQVEKIEHLQLALWDLENQTRDNVRLINNAIMIYRNDLDDIDAYEFGPGERWGVEGNPSDSIQMWSPDPIAANIALPHLARLEQMMQNLAGGYPFTSTSEARNTGADTATEAALVTNLAQASTMRLKEQLNYSHERVGQQRTELNKQFIRMPVMAERIGLDSQQEFVEITPMMLNAGDYLFDMSPQAESLMRNERRAEANAKFQMALQAVPVSAALAQAGAATALNFDEFVKDWLKEYGEDVPDRFFSAKPQPQVSAPPGSPPGAPPAAEGQGVTNAPLATSDLTQNIMAAPQQMAARVGGLNNAG